jgi:hypothetical protein
MKERVLLFPADQEVGWVLAYRGEECVLRMPARGEVRVPLGTQVILQPKPPVHGLYDLAPDDIFHVEVRKKSGTDNDLRHLAHLTGVRNLDCSKSHAITDAGVAHIAGLRELRELDLYWTAVTDASLEAIGRMHQLTHLHLGLTKVTGPGVVHLARLQKLWRLSLECTTVDDSVVPILATLSSLRRLALWDTRITVDGLARLRAALPNCSVELPEPVPNDMAPDGVRDLLLGRVQAALRGQGHEGIDRELLLECAITGMRGESGVIEPFKEPWRVAKALRGLARFEVGMDLHVVGPAGVDVWVAWLRRRGEERRKASRKVVAGIR